MTKEFTKDEIIALKEIDFIMNDDYEGIDWLQNNMDYSDFENVIIVEKSENNVEVDWMNAETDIVIRNQKRCLENDRRI